MPFNRTFRFPIYAACLWLVTLPGCDRSPRSEAKYLERAKVLLAKKDYNRAILELKNAVRIVSDDAEAYYQIGLAELGSGNTAEAIANFRRATELNPKHAAAQLKVAEFMTASRDSHYAGEAITRLLGLQGTERDNPEVSETLAMADVQLGKREDASKLLVDSLQRFPARLQTAEFLASLRVRQNDLPGAEEALQTAIANAPNSVEAVLALGQLYLMAGQLGKAEVEVRRAIQLDPKNGRALRTLAGIQVATKRLDEAEQSYRQLSALAVPDYRPLHAIFLYQNGKQEAALAEFQHLAQADPDDRKARKRLVTAYFGMHKIAEAESVLDAVLKKNPQDIDALLQRSQLRVAAGKPEEAEKDLLQVLHYVPDSAEDHAALGLVYVREGSDWNGQQELTRALQMNPALLDARLGLARSFLRSNWNKSALETIDQAPSNQKKLLPVLIQRNWILVAMGNLPELKAGVERASQAGTSPEITLQRSALEFMERDYSGARGGAEELLKGDPENTNAAVILAETYRAQGQRARGIQRLKELAADRPGSAPLQHLLGQWYLGSGDSAQARKAYEAALSADPKFVQSDLALADLDLSAGAIQPARQRLNRIIAANPENVSALLLLANAENRTGDPAAVMATYRAILRIDQSNTIALNNLAYRLALQNPDEGLRLAQQAERVAPDNPYVQDTLAFSYYRKGLYSSAVNCLKASVAREPTPKRQYHLGMSYLKSGDRALGQRTLAAALRQDPGLEKAEREWQ